MEFKGTPAPWVVADDFGFNANHSGSRYHYIASGKGFHDDFSNTGFDIAGIMSIHDANLIAAAPELLEALIEMQRNGRKQGWNDSYESSMEKTRLAIAKALGQQ